jgi:CheY-like chemotaxis protein/two-component sensor histidine kinase
VSSANLLSLINDILDFSRIDEGRIEFNSTRIALRELVEKIKLSNSFAANDRGNELTVEYGADLPGFVQCDEVRLSQILNNLVSNAVKFTHRGKVTIEVTKQGETANRETIRFVVKDTGIGIAPQSQGRIFERFTQANSDIDRRYGGSGLGLAIVKKLLQLQGSDIYVESELGKGSIFSFSLDMGKDIVAPPSTEPISEEVQADLTGVRILLVEDMPFNQLMATAMLKQWNAVVDLADNGQIAVDLCQQHKYDLVLMDLQMPVMDGISAVKAIRCFDSHIPVIALTASASVEMQDEIRRSGFHEYIAKPFTPSNLYMKIKKCLMA